MNISLTQKPCPAPSQIVAAPIRPTALDWLLGDTNLTAFAVVRAEFGDA